MTAPAQAPPTRASSRAGGAGRVRASGLAGRKLRDRIRPWMLLTPALAVLGVLLLWPLVRVFLFSLQDYGLREIVSGDTNWAGFDNYLEALTSTQLWQVVLPNTVVFAVLAVAGTVAFGTGVAILMANGSAEGSVESMTA